MHAESERFYPKKMNDGQLVAAESFRDTFATVATRITDALPAGRCRSIALTKLEESAMFVTKAITHEWETK